MLVGDEAYQYLKNTYCSIKWILIFVVFFTLDSAIYSNLLVFENLTVILTCISIWNGCLYYTYKKLEDNRKNTYWLSVVELASDIISVIFLAEAQASYGDGFLYTILLVLIGIAFIRYGLSVTTYIMVSFIVVTIAYINYEVYTYTYLLKTQKIVIVLTLVVGICFCMYLVAKENKRLKLLITIKEEDIKDLEKNVRSIQRLSELIATVYRSNDIDSIITHLLGNIYKLTSCEGIGLILYGQNNVESDARRYTYLDVKDKKESNAKNIPYQPFYAQRQLQAIRSHKAYKNCILSYEPINKESNTEKIIYDMLPGTEAPYIYLFNIMEGDVECGMIVCNTDKRLSIAVCKQIDELIKYAGFAFLKVRVLENERSKVMYDTLTGVRSRRYLDEILPIMVEKAHRNKGQIGIIFFDIDKFKHINDTYGHTIGDVVLKEVAGTIENNMPKDALVGRYGGEEFVGVIEDGSVEKCLEIAEKIRQSIAQFSFYNYTGEDTYITISSGVAIYKEGACTMAETISHADHAMYEAKKTRNKVCLYQASKEEDDGNKNFRFIAEG